MVFVAVKLVAFSRKAMGQFASHSRVRSIPCERFPGNIRRNRTMNDDETFTPETIEELIDQHTSSPSSQPTTPQASIIQELQTYYEADQRSAARMWERLVQHTKLKASANEIEK